MKWKIVLFRVLIIALILFTAPVVFAYAYTIKDIASEQSIFTLDTKYDAACYYPKENESYNIDLVWEDLHLSFLYTDESRISNNWIKDNSLILNNTTLKESNSILDSSQISSFILIKNESDFPISVSGKTGQSDKYVYGDNYIKLEIAHCNNVCSSENLSFMKEINYKKLLNKSEIKIIVKPIIENTKKYNIGENIVTENVKLVFKKTN